MLAKEFECNCDYCQSLCYYRVGWPLPEEAEALIEFFLSKGLSIGEIFRKYLVIDWWETEKENEPIFIIAPRWADCGENLFAPFCPVIRQGGCVFKEKDKCLLHGLTYKGIPLKPLECRTAGCDASNDGMTVRRHIAKEWGKRKDLIEKYFGNYEYLRIKWLNQLASIPDTEPENPCF